jgi:hypothetical protein
VESIVGIEGRLGHERPRQQRAGDLARISIYLRAVLVEQRVALAGGFKGLLD